VYVNDSDGRAWRLPRAASHPAPVERVDVDVSGTGDAIAVMADVHVGPAPSDAFERHVASRRGEYRAAVILRRRAHLDPTEGAELAGSLSEEIRELAAAHATTNVHLFPRIPFPLALLLGRGLNTLTVQVFEWDDEVRPDAYRPAIALTPGHGGPASPLP
jgi:hypothetical protein